MKYTKYVSSGKYSYSKPEKSILFRALILKKNDSMEIAYMIF